MKLIKNIIPVLMLVVTLFATTNSNAQKRNNQESGQALAKGAMAGLVVEAKAYFVQGMSLEEFITASEGDASSVSAQERAVFNDIYGFVRSNTSQVEIMRNYNGKSILAAASHTGANSDSIDQKRGRGLFGKISRTLRLIADIIDIWCCGG